MDWYLARVPTENSNNSIVSVCARNVQKNPSFRALARERERERERGSHVSFDHRSSLLCGL